MPKNSATETLLRGASDYARKSLIALVDPPAVGQEIDHVFEGENVVSFRYECLKPGYPGWLWVVSLGALDGHKTVTVLESELMPGEGALLAPAWIPWSERLAEELAPEPAEPEVSVENGSSRVLLENEESVELPDDVLPEELADIDDIDEVDIDTGSRDVIDDDDVASEQN